MDPSRLWGFFPVGYLFTVLIETPVLMVGLSREHSIGRRLFAGLWLTACTYPIVVIVLPLVFDVNEQRVAYLVVAETFAPLGECLLFWAAFGSAEYWSTRSMWRDFAAIVVANLLSFGLGEVAHHYGLFRWLDPA